jgi:hypothetical protein
MIVVDFVNARILSLRRGSLISEPNAEAPLSCHSPHPPLVRPTKAVYC